MKRILACVLSVLLLSGFNLSPIEAQVKTENKITINNKEIPKELYYTDSNGKIMVSTKVLDTLGYDTKFADGDKNVVLGFKKGSLWFIIKTREEVNKEKPSKDYLGETMVPSTMWMTTTYNFRATPEVSYEVFRDKYFDAKINPIIKGEHLYVAFTDLATLLYSEMSWNPSTKTANIDTTKRLTIWDDYFQKRMERENKYQIDNSGY